MNARRHTVFPRRVWEPTAGGKVRTLWASRPVTAEDRKRRNRVAVMLRCSSSTDGEEGVSP